jgi:hypothetical protein
MDVEVDTMLNRFFACLALLFVLLVAPSFAQSYGQQKVHVQLQNGRITTMTLYDAQRLQNKGQAIIIGDARGPAVIPYGAQFYPNGVPAPYHIPGTYYYNPQYHDKHYFPWDLPDTEGAGHGGQHENSNWGWW